MYQVMIIEDDPMVASINQKYVELNRNLKVAGIFSNGQDALLYLEKHPVDLAIMDFYMPVMNGLELLREIRSRNKTLDVIMVTAANDTAHIKQLLSLGIIDYLVKPFEYVRFNHALAKFIEHQELLKQNNFSQEQLDALLDISPVSATARTEVLHKGLQETTLRLILSFMKEHRLQSLTSKQIASGIRLSQVTVRRYMDYLVEKQEITKDIDYTTGGRPSIIYRYIK
ncbi:MAG: response regulator [Lachnospiraceae bacterium]|nr:response regulator [Lachnospiraceae bacterium]